MIKPIKQACEFNPVIKDYKMAGGIENLTDLIDDEGDGTEFFERNYITEGMAQLFKEGMLRLAGKTDQAVFELSQAMGGGKTHMMIALGLLAKHSHLRKAILPAELSQRLDFTNARIAAFTGRNTPENYIWGDIASQLGAAEQIKSHWVNGPKEVDQNTWKQIIGDQPTLIMLDELPPYLDVATTKTYGKGSLAQMVVFSLSALMSAALELPNCCVVITNLSGSYEKQTKALKEVIDNLQQETNRQSMSITPVQLAGNEIYEILKKRLINKLPNEEIIADIAEEYAAQIKKAESSGYITAASIEQLTEEITQTYPFHPSFKHIVTLFKENEGFRQTRGLMQFTARLLNSVAERENDDVFLIGTQHLDLNNTQVKDELQRISPKIVQAIPRDIADGGNALAEKIDAEQQSDAATQVMTLLIASSLSRAVGARNGLSESELIEFLAAPNRKADEFLTTLKKLREQAWYLHKEEQRFLIKETENLSKKIERNAKDVPQVKVNNALINHLQGFLQPQSRKLYQQLQVLPKLAEINLSGPRVLLVIKPDGKIPPAELNNFFESQQHKNNFLILSGEDSTFADAVETKLREFYAIEQIKVKLKAGDTLFEEANERFEEARDRFLKALSAAYNTIWYPGIDANNSNQECLVKTTLDNNLKLGENEQSAELQLEQLMAEPRANKKLALDFKNKLPSFFAEAETKLWRQGSRRIPWKDITVKAKCNTSWPWLPGTNGMDDLKNAALAQSRWRLGSDGYIEKGPFPKETTSVNITTNNTDAETGETTLCLTPRHAGDNPVIYYASHKQVTEQDIQVTEPENFITKEATLYFLAIDPDGNHQPGEPSRWVAELKIRYDIENSGTKRRIILQCTPNAAMTYSLGGTNAKEGSSYNQPIEIGREEVLLQVVAQAGEAQGKLERNIPKDGDTSLDVDDYQPVTFTPTKGVSLDDTEKTFIVIEKFRDQPDTKFKGVRIEIGEGEHTIRINFGSRGISASVLETTITSLREALGERDAAVNVIIKESINFTTGADAKDFAEKLGIKLSAANLQQQK